MVWRMFSGKKKAALKGDTRLALERPSYSPPFTPKRNITQQRRVKSNTALGFQAVLPAEQQGGSLGITDAGTLHVRLNLLMLVLLAVFGVVASRLAFVALTPPAEPRPSLREMPREALRRGNIYDRNGILLAATLQVYSLSADPQRVLDPEEIAEKLPQVLPDLSPVHLLSQLTEPRRRFIWIKRRLTPEQAARVHALGLPGLELRREFVRAYPHQQLAPHLLGAVDIDNNGLAGVERGFNTRLNRGEDVHLALDVRLQERLRQRVAEALLLSEAKAAWGVVLKTRTPEGKPTREIVALVSLPDFDPNHFGRAEADTRFNRVTQGSYEMGSTFKLFTVAQGLVNGAITANTKIDARQPIQIGRFTIKDYRAKKAILSVEEVLRYSSNIGAAKIADLGGPEKQRAFLEELGLLEPLNAGIAEVGQPRWPSNWGRVQTFTIAFGHGMSVTPLHMAAAAATLADGLYMPPSVLKGGVGMDGKMPAVRTVIENPQTLEDVHRLMRDVVLNGSGRSSQLAGYDIGGKTGTAEKIGAGGGYLKDKNLVSFVAALPMKNPEYVVLVMVDEPKKGYETGGRIAAPTVGAFFRDLTQVISLPPYMPEVEMFRSVLQRSKRTESDPYAPYILTDMRTRTGLAAGVRNEPVADTGHD
jgi:cell division protein FtsI (penicillin-binding protein 3)